MGVWNSRSSALTAFKVFPLGRCAVSDALLEFGETHKVDGCVLSTVRDALLYLGDNRARLSTIDAQSLLCICTFSTRRGSESDLSSSNVAPTRSSVGHSAVDVDGAQSRSMLRRYSVRCSCLYRERRTPSRAWRQMISTEE
jgi:hypothetical protein